MDGTHWLDLTKEHKIMFQMCKYQGEAEAKLGLCFCVCEDQHLVVSGDQVWPHSGDLEAQVSEQDGAGAHTASLRTGLKAGCLGWAGGQE